MKKLLSIITLLICILSLSSCKKDESTLYVGATPSPHAEILKSDAVQNYFKERGYKLEVKVYQDYATLNKALNDKGIDANYFQHENFLNEEIKNYGFDLSVACLVHNEPLNLYGKTYKEDFSGETIYIINDKSNVERAFKLLLASGLIDSYDVTNFNAGRPVYTSSKNVKIECLEAGLLNIKVNQGGYAVIPGNYALNAWGTKTATSYKILGETTDVALPNVIAVRTESLNNPLIKVLVDALGEEEVKEFIESTYGPTVNYVYKSNLE